MNDKFKKDLNLCINVINNHQQKDNIVDMFIKGPPNNTGFMWCSSEGGPNEWWTNGEANGLKFIRKHVLDLGYDSGMYGIFMRQLQYKIRQA